MKTQVSEHEKLFDEICGKLNELSHNYNSNQLIDPWTERLELMQNNLKKSQEELLQAHLEIQEKIKTLDSITFTTNDLNEEISRLTQQLEAERANGTRLSTELSKSLELNLKFQFESEEIRTKTNQILVEERKHIQYLTEKNKNVNEELELSQALCNEARTELNKAIDNFQSGSANWQIERQQFQQTIDELKIEIDSKQSELQQFQDYVQVENTRLQNLINQKDDEIKNISENLSDYESHLEKQNEAMKELSSIAEKKIIELKVAFDKKTVESQDYYNHLQHALTQMNILKQENVTLKEYINRLTNLHKEINQEIMV